MHQEAEPLAKTLHYKNIHVPIGEGGWVTANSCSKLSQLETLTQNIKESKMVEAAMGIYAWGSASPSCTQMNEDLLRSTR